MLGRCLSFPKSRPSGAALRRSWKDIASPMSTSGDLICAFPFPVDSALA
jgi:hypothetical protein